MIDVVLAVNSDIKIAPANIQITPRIRARIDLGALSPYLKHTDKIFRALKLDKTRYQSQLAR